MAIEPLTWTRGSLRVLDQTALPRHERRIGCRTPADVARAIRELRVRGAPLIGIAAAYGLALAPNSLDAVARAAKVLASARPTAVNLRAAVDRVMKAIAVTRGRDVRAIALAEARRIHAEDAAMCESIGRHGARLLPRGARVLTICNTGALATGGIGTAYGVIKRARVSVVYACETRPVSQGARLTMYELAHDRIPGVLIADGAAAAALREHAINAVLAGADRIARNGDTANKVGTYALAIAAREHGIPFYIAAPRTTVDLAIASGRDIPIEQRAESEVLRDAPAGARAWNPAFDVTPARLISSFITDSGVVPASRLRTVIRDS